MTEFETLWNPIKPRSAHLIDHLYRLNHELSGAFQRWNMGGGAGQFYRDSLELDDLMRTMSPPRIQTPDPRTSHDEEVAAHVSEWIRWAKDGKTFTHQSEYTEVMALALRDAGFPAATDRRARGLIHDQLIMDYLIARRDWPKTYESLEAAKAETWGINRPDPQPDPEPDPHPDPDPEPQPESDPPPPLPDDAPASEVVQRLSSILQSGPLFLIDHHGGHSTVHLQPAGLAFAEHLLSAAAITYREGRELMDLAKSAAYDMDRLSDKVAGKD